jgi:hypothetical protein
MFLPMSITDSLRYAEDFTNATDCLLSQNQKAVYVVYMTNDQVAFDDPSTQRTVIQNKITIADGYRAWTAPLISPYDGFLYPRVRERKANILVQGKDQLTLTQVEVGSLVLPYCFNGCNYGTDPDVFTPGIGKNSNVQVYLRIFGFGLPDTANLYTIKEVKLSGTGIQEGISYKLIAEANGLNIGE